MTADEKRLYNLHHNRIRRAKRILRWMPRKANLGRYPVLKWFPKIVRGRPYLWSFKIESCTPAFYFGSVISFMPLMGVQIPLAFLAALFLRANLPIIVALQGITNPLTIPFIYPINFYVGRQFMNFLDLGMELNPIVRGMHATFLGGALIGLVVGTTLDLLYRLMLYEARRHGRGRRSSKPAGEQTEESPSISRPPAEEAGKMEEPEQDEVIR